MVKALSLGVFALPMTTACTVDTSPTETTSAGSATPAISLSVSQEVYFNVPVTSSPVVLDIPADANDPEVQSDLGTQRQSCPRLIFGKALTANITLANGATAQFDLNPIPILELPGSINGFIRSRHDEPLFNGVPTA